MRGETITWLVSHEFAQEHNEDVDYKVFFEKLIKSERFKLFFKVMRTFTEFYAATLGFVMFKLYSEANLKYPPLAQSESDESDEKVQQQQADIEALTLQLRKRFLSATCCKSSFFILTLSGMSR